MRVAIPVADGKLAMHFGHCEKFMLMDLDLEAQSITATKEIEAPPHVPGMLPPWLAEQGANLVIAGGMGQRAQQLFQAQNIEVLTGAASREPEALVREFMAGCLSTGPNACDH